MNGGKGLGFSASSVYFFCVLRASKVRVRRWKVQMKSDLKLGNQHSSRIIHTHGYYSCRRILDGLTRTVRMTTKIIDKNANNSQSKNAVRNDVNDKSM